MASGLTGTVAAHLLISQAKVSHMETGRRAVSPRNVRDLCKLYGVTDQHVVDSLMGLARKSGRQGWWHSCSDIPHSVYIDLETEAASIHTYESMVIPALLQTPAYAAAGIEETIPLVTVEQAAARLKVRLRRQHRIYDPARPLSLWVVLDESALRRVVGSRAIMREQLEHLHTLSTEPHITVQVLHHTAGAHPGLTGQFSILEFPDSCQAVVYLERYTTGHCLEKPTDVQQYQRCTPACRPRPSAPATPGTSSPRPSSTPRLGDWPRRNGEALTGRRPGRTASRHGDRGVPHTPFRPGPGGSLVPSRVGEGAPIPLSGSRPLSPLAEW
ncbi:helix-turn-helix domain-containing protein [Streptomyces sp. NPDC003027]